jgi:AAA15 family ATPase/GTPase
MLIRFSIENFLSFAARTEFSLIPGKSRVRDFHVIAAQKSRDIPVLKAGIIYGANASGKSNFVKALAFAKNFILQGTRTENEKINLTNFRLDKSFSDQPSRFEFEIKYKGKNYAYGFECNNNEVLEEWLFEINKETDKPVFERKPDSGKSRYDFSGIKFEAKEEEQFIRFTGNGTRKNQLFITECKVRNVRDNVSGIEDIFNVLDWFQNALKIIFPNTKYQQGLEFELKYNQDVNEIFREFLEYFNTGIKGVEFEDMSIEDIPGLPPDLKNKVLQDTSEAKKVFISDPFRNITYAVNRDEKGELKVFKMMTRHDVQHGVKEELFEVSEESDGTQRIIDLIPVIMDLFKGDNVFVIDEVDRSLHPNLTYDLIDLFLTRSKGINSQLIVTTHESGLLSQRLVRKDEVWFVIKDEAGASTLYSLEEFKVRFDKEIRKDYLLGRFKAIPVFGSRNHLTVLNP